MASPDVADLARRWAALGAPVHPHAALRDKGRALIDASPDVQRATGIAPALKDGIDRAVAASGAAIAGDGTPGAAPSA